MLWVEDLSCIVTPTASLPASTTIHFIHSQWQGLPSGFTCPSPCVCVLQFNNNNNNKTSITFYNKGGRHPPQQMSVTLHAALFLNHAGVWWMQSLAGFYLLCVNYRNLIYVLYILPTYSCVRGFTWVIHHTMHAWECIFVNMNCLTYILLNVNYHKNQYKLF